MAGSEPYIGEIALFPFNFAPSGWLSCDGGLLRISDNTALFSLIGNTYGGDGRSTFGLPNLNGRAVVGVGQGPGLSPYDWGQLDGQAEVTLNVPEIPNHAHVVQVRTGGADVASPVGAVPAAADVPLRNAAPTVVERLEPVGRGEPHNNMQPSLALHYCIATRGIFPSRS